MEGERRQYAENDKVPMDVVEKDARSCMVGEINDAVDLNDDKLIDVEEVIKVVGESLRSLSFCKRMT